MSKKRLYAEITKSEKQDDGTIIVEGFASSGAEDSDKEVITPDAMKAALPDYMRFGNVREMHDAKKAAGTALEAEVQEDGRTRFVAHVVDPVAVLKVETGVYKGFSIGARVPKGGRDAANKSIIKAIELLEVSLVDRPANPDAVFTCFKSEGAQEDADDTVVDAPPAAEDDPVQKGLWNMQSLIAALGQLRDCCVNVNYEVQQGEHTQKMADAIKECMLALGEATKKYLNEELGVLAGMSTKAAEPTGDDLLVKAQGELAAVVAERDELKKSLDDRDAQRAEELSDISEIAKAAGLQLEEGADYPVLLKATFVELGKARAKLEEALSKAANPKGYRMAVSKAADQLGAPEAEVKPVVKADGTTDDVATLIKAAQTRPIPVTL